MSTTTTNLGLIKLELTDPADITAMNPNWDMIDEKLNSVSRNDCSNTDFNDLKTPGFYYGYTGMTNAAFQEISVLEVIQYSNDWLLQRHTRLTDGRMYYRTLSFGNTWSDWEVINTSKHPNYSYSTTDLTAGSSALETGKLYFVYE